MRIKLKEFLVSEGKKLDLELRPTRISPVYKSDKNYQEMLSEHVQTLSEQQELLYASSSHAILIIFQAMDAAGKDGAIAHVMSGVNPQGCQVFSFAQPSAT